MFGNMITKPDPALFPLPIHVWFVLLPGTLTLDWAGASETLRMANQVLADQGAPARFVLHFCGPEPQARGSTGVCMSALEPLPMQLDAPAWIVLSGAAGARMDAHSSPSRALLHWLRGLRLAPSQTELVTICAGSVLAAHAGLLAGRQATTHHLHLEELAEVEPRCMVQHERIFVEDGAVASSAGVTTGIDLMVHRVARHCSGSVAAQVAQRLVLPMRRSTHDPQLSPFLAWRNHLHPALHRVQDAVCAAPEQDWDTARMADVACTSTRHLSRLFVRHAGIPPLHWLRQIRLAMACSALEAGHSVGQAAAVAGFSSDTQLRRAWRQGGLPGSPSRHNAQARACQPCS